jgi:cold shock CspA family protein
VAEQRGHVVDYDARRGLGAVEDDHGHRFGFHCTAVDDGARDLTVGVPVSFRVAPGHLGAWEAVTVRSP